MKTTIISQEIDISMIPLGCPPGICPDNPTVDYLLRIRKRSEKKGNGPYGPKRFEGRVVVGIFGPPTGFPDSK